MDIRCTISLQRFDDGSFFYYMVGILLLKQVNPINALSSWNICIYQSIDEYFIHILQVNKGRVCVCVCVCDIPIHCRIVIVI